MNEERETRKWGKRRTFVTGVVEVDEVFLPFFRQRGCVDGITVVLARDVAAPCRQIECGNVVSAVSVLELDGTGTGSKGK